MPCSALVPQDYIVSNFERTATSAVAVVNLKKRLADLFSIWQGGYFEAGGRFVCYQADLSEEEQKDVRTRLGSAFISCVLHAAPARPSLGKWNALPRCLDWYVLALAGHILGPLVRKSTEKMDRCQESTDIEVVEDACEAFMVDVSWQKLVSKGRTHALSCFGNPDWGVKVVDVPVSRRTIGS